MISKVAQDNHDALRELEERLGYRFKDSGLLQRALIHSSFAFEQGLGENNEILEFLGDAVLDLTVGASLIRRFPDMKEGELTRMRAVLVNENSLAEMARNVELGAYLCLGKGEDSSLGREKSSILACAYEAVVGAIFRDGGFDDATRFVELQFSSVLKQAREKMLQGDAKSRLQEKIQENHNEAPVYRVDLEEGPAHDKRFTVSVLFNGEVLGTGVAKSKKEAEQLAAASALKKIDEG